MSASGKRLSEAGDEPAESPTNTKREATGDQPIAV